MKKIAKNRLVVIWYIILVAASFYGATRGLKLLFNSDFMVSGEPDNLEIGRKILAFFALSLTVMVFLTADYSARAEEIKGKLRNEYMFSILANFIIFLAIELSIGALLYGIMGEPAAHPIVFILLIVGIGVLFVLNGIAKDKLYRKVESIERLEVENEERPILYQALIIILLLESGNSISIAKDEGKYSELAVDWLVKNNLIKDYTVGVNRRRIKSEELGREITNTILSNSISNSILLREAEKATEDLMTKGEVSGFIDRIVEELKELVKPNK